MREYLLKFCPLRYSGVFKLEAIAVNTFVTGDTVQKNVNGFAFDKFINGHGYS